MEGKDMVEAVTLNSTQGVAVLLMALGEEYAAEIFKHLDRREVYKISATMASLADISLNQVSEVLHKFNQEVESQTSIGVRSQDYISNVLIRALGRDKAKGIMEHIFNTDQVSGIDALKWMDASAIAGSLRNEHPQIIALVLFSLESEQAAEVVRLLPEELRYEALVRMITLDGIPAQALTELNELVENQLLTTTDNAATSKVDGLQRTAAILGLLGGDIEGPILNRLSEVNVELSEKIKDLMLIFDNLLGVEDRSIQILLRDVPSQTLKVALRGADDMIRQKILRNMSTRAAEILLEDLEVMAPVRMSEVEKAQKEILAIAKRLAESGELSLSRETDPLV
jgi:flagellar motor switch protein FliG